MLHVPQQQSVDELHPHRMSLLAQDRGALAAAANLGAAALFAMAEHAFVDQHAHVGLG